MTDPLTKRELLDWLATEERALRLGYREADGVVRHPMALEGLRALEAMSVLIDSLDAQTVEVALEHKARKSRKTRS